MNSPASASPDPDLETIRAAFPILRKVVYLNTGTCGPMPEPALCALIESVEEMERSGIASETDIGGLMSEARRRVAALLDASPEEIAFGGNATDGINLALAGIDWKPGDEVLTTDEEHEAMIHPLLHWRNRAGIGVKRLPVSPDAATMIERLERAATERTRLVAMSHVTCETGTRLPVAEIAAWAAERGILSLVDGAQAVGVFPVSVRRIGCDFYAGNGHKWLCGPTGTGIFYARRDRLAELTPAHVGAGSLESANAETLEARLKGDAGRFEFGTRDWSLWRGLIASLDWLEGWGWDRLEARMKALADDAKERILARPSLESLTPRAWEESSGLTSFRLKDSDAGAALAALRARRGIVLRHVPHYNAIRVATAHFNSREDLDRLFDALDEWMSEPR